MSIRPHLVLCVLMWPGPGCSDAGTHAPEPSQTTAPNNDGSREDRDAVLVADASLDDDAGWDVTEAVDEQRDGAVVDAAVARPPDASETGDGLDGLVRLDLEFVARVGDGELACDTLADAVGNGPAIELRDGRFFVHDVRLIRPDGTGEPATIARDGRFHNGRVALLDFENGEGRCETGDPEENHVLRVGVKAGTYRGVAFRIGVPEDLNHEDPTAAQPPLDVTAMHWGWTAGYRFLRFDTRFDGGGSFNVHLGSTECSAGSPAGTPVCARSNRPLIVLAELDPTRERIVFKYDALVAGLDPVDDIPGCIAGGTPEQCKPVMAALGLDQTTGDSSGLSQVVFTVEDK